MKSTPVMFNSLEDLARYLKIVQPTSYLINTSAITLRAPLSSFELALALEQYGGRVDPALSRLL